MKTATPTTTTPMDIEKPDLILNLAMMVIRDSNLQLQEVLKFENISSSFQWKKYRIVLATMDSKIVEGMLVEKNNSFILESRRAYQLVPL